MAMTAVVVVVVVGERVEEADGAVVEVVLYSPVGKGGYVTQGYTLSGVFAPCALRLSAEGRIVQVCRCRW